MGELCNNGFDIPKGLVHIHNENNEMIPIKTRWKRRRITSFNCPIKKWDTGYDFKVLEK